MKNDDEKILLPRGGTVTLRPVSAEDEEFLVSVYASTRAQELAQVPWSDEQKAQFVRWQFNLQRLDYDKNFPKAEYDVIVVDDQPAGRIWFNREDDHIRVLDLAILDEFQNRGIGTTLLRRLIDEAAGANKLLKYMVFVLNTEAMRLYKRLGFVVVGEVGAYVKVEWRKDENAITADD